MGDQMHSQQTEPHTTDNLSQLAVPRRERLPDTRNSVTHKFIIDKQEGYITVGLFPDGRPGEVFIKMAKQGSAISGLTDTIGILTSIALQYGVPVEVLAKKLEYLRFEPSGWTRCIDVRVAHSVTDYIFRWLGINLSPEYGAYYHAKSSDPSTETVQTS